MTAAAHQTIVMTGATSGFGALAKLWEDCAELVDLDRARKAAPASGLRQ